MAKKSIRKILQENAEKYPHVSVDAPQHILDQINSRRKDEYRLKEFRVVVQKGKEDSLTDEDFLTAYSYLEAVDESEWTVIK